MALTDEEEAALRAQLAAAQAVTADDPPVIVNEAPTTETVVAGIEAEGDARVKVIHAETAQQVAIIAATSNAEQVAAGAETDDDGQVVHDDPRPESTHWYFRGRKAKR